MSFFPPLFSKIGSTASDLLAKKYDYKNSLTTKQKVDDNLTVTIGTDAAQNGLNGNAKVNFVDKTKDIEAEVTTTGITKCQLKLKKAAPGTVVTVNVDQSARTRLVADYVQHGFAGSATVEACGTFAGPRGPSDSFKFPKTKVIASGVVGYDGLSVGGEVTLDAAAPSEVKDYNIGAQYQLGKYIVAAKTSEKANVLTASFYEFVNPRLLLSSTFGWRLDGTAFAKPKDESKAGASRVLTLGAEYAVNPNVTVRAKLDSTGGAATWVQTNLPDNRLQVAISSSYNLTSGPVAKPVAFGIQTTFGDY